MRTTLPRWLSSFCASSLREKRSPSTTNRRPSRANTSREPQCSVARHLGQLPEDHLHVGQPVALQLAARHRRAVAALAGLGIAPVDPGVVGELRVEHHVEQAALAAAHRPPAARPRARRGGRRARRCAAARRARSRGSGRRAGRPPPRGWPGRAPRSPAWARPHGPAGRRSTAAGSAIDAWRISTGRCAMLPEAALSLPPRPPSAPAAGPAIRPGSAGRPGARARPPARRGRTRWRRAALPAWRTRSFRCFSPTSRCCSTSTSSQNSGASKPWPQTCASSSATVCGVEPLERQRPVGAQRARQRGGVEPLAGHLLQGARRSCRSALRRCVQPAAIAWPPKRSSTPRVALGHQVERIAQVKAGDRAARALEQPVGAAREDEGRPVQPVLQARRRRCRPRLRGTAGRTATARSAARCPRAGISRSSARLRPARACRPRPRAARG